MSMQINLQHVGLFHVKSEGIVREGGMSGGICLRAIVGALLSCAFLSMNRFQMVPFSMISMTLSDL